MVGASDPTEVGRKLTYEDYVGLPDDGRRYEILDGELAVTPAPTTLHQRVSLSLAVLLYQHVREHGLGQVLEAPVDVILEPTTIVQPDIVFVAKDRLSIITKRAVEGPPDLVIEILSDSTARRDRGAKLQLYARTGVDHYWIVSPESRTLELYERIGETYRHVTTHADDAVVQSTAPPELEIALGEVWES